MMDLGIANSTGEVEASGGDKKKDTKKDDKKKDKKGAAGEVAAGAPGYAAGTRRT